MHKNLVQILISGLLISACGGMDGPSPTLTTAPVPTSVPIQAEPILARELEIETQSGTAYTLDWSPDGETLAVASGGEITLLSEDLTETYAILKPDGGALGVTWNPDGSQFATVNGFRNQTITLWDWDSNDVKLTKTQKIQADSDQYGVSWSPDGNYLASLADDRRTIIQFWDARTRQELHIYELPYTNPRRALRWNRNTATLYGAGESKGLLIVFALNMADGTVEELGKFPLASAEVFAIAPDAKRLAVADVRGVAQIIDLASGKVFTGFKSVEQPVDMAWNPNGMTLAILDYKTKLQLWDIAP